ncbi:hypothetical protein HRG_000032 [Hirsutella rhossiliensis]|uniref:Uncharacterized protein n=1 Tax=Hirsutella rhossiliensis TaxID=111463 RepID=A0A9P8N5U3_9HYPO|nr:uncharacterized protein HRG_00032 [Hirsutella rhossiliensis]KAH0967390.1 hypothetical protein HRG_00032 [Hirsutella rhossiliensis]
MAACSPAPDLLQRSTSLRARRDPSSTTLHCCCGRVDCVFLRKSCSVLETVEKDVHTAAQLGQALLARHEAYMADAERDRLDLTGRIERLQHDKQDLEAVNASKIEENRSLLDQLEALNHTVSDSDTRIKALEASLLASQQTVRRLEAAAARAADAEHHIAVLEEEQDRLYQELRSTKDDARTHAQRFKEAQRGILDMQDQLERMEEEARQENARHAEVVGRMERQRDIDKQLDVAAGRLKGAAASKSLQEQTNGNKIVGHFVRDLLEDNANLQLGMAELREMLISSNDEIQSLRDQLMHHQPVSQDNAGQARTLKAELGSMQGSPKLSQELHIHHHYHVAGTPKKQEVRKPRKRRQGLLPGVYASPASPRPPAQWGPASSPAAPALVSPATGAATPASSKPRHSWGGVSNPCSDLSSSPGSSPSGLGSAVFDTSFADSDLMTSPTTSFDPMSPTWRASHSKRPSNASSKSFQSISMSLMDTAPTTPPGKQPAVHVFPSDTIQEEDEDEDALPQGHGKTPVLVVERAHSPESSVADDPDYFQHDAVVHSRLLRAPSHESIMSLAGGLDIHTLKSRPSQMTLRRLGGADAVVTGVTARPTLSSASGKRSDVALRDHFAGFQTPRTVSSPGSRPLSPGPSPASQGGSRAFGRWVGWRPWGAGSRPTPGSSPTLSYREKDGDANRSPGINQPGAIPGFQQYWAAQRRKGAPAKVTAETVDRDALIEGLQE